MLRKFVAFGLAGALTFASPSFASHVNVPPYKGKKPVEARGLDVYCDTEERYGVESEAYHLFRNRRDYDTLVFYLNKEKVPFAIFVIESDPKNEKVFPSNTVWYDLDRDNHVDGRAKPETEPVGGGPCDMIPHLKKKK